MTPARWQQVETLLSQALDLPAAERLDFIRFHCGGELELEREVLSLIAAHEHAPAASASIGAVREVLGALETEYYLGRNVGRYFVEEVLGRGGASTVYRARDVESGNIVALKIFAPRVTPPSRDILSIEHPNVAKLFHYDRDGEAHYIAMECVEGETAAQRIRKLPIAVPELIPMARQIAAGLEAAHRRGICHGDLKPANLMLGKGGVVKILDFGSAGGTAAYLPPERAASDAATPASDVFSFGATLHELATRRRDFTIPARHYVDHPALTDLLERCLDGDPRRRFPDASALLRALDPLKPPSALARLKQYGRQTRAAALVVAMLAAGWAWSALVPLKRPASFEALTEDANLHLYPALSPDGKLVVYAANRNRRADLDMWVQAVHGGAPTRLTTHEADDYTPSFSPDGKFILFASDRDGGGIYRVPAVGGQEEKIGPAGVLPQYSPDGRWISYATGPRGPRDRGAYMPRRIYLLPAAGGEPKSFHAEFSSAFSTVWSPDAQRILFAGQMREQDPLTWWVGKLDGSTPTPVSAPSPARSSGFLFKQYAMLPRCWLPDGRLVLQYQQGVHVSLMATAFSLQQSRFVGIPQNVAGADFARDPFCGPNGELVYASVRGDVDFWSVSLDEAHALLPITRTHGAARLPSITADGKRLLYLIAGNRSSSARLFDLESGEDHTLEVTKPLRFWFRQSADGAKTAVLDDDEQGGTLRIMNAANHTLGSFPNVTGPLDFSADSKFVLAEGTDRPSAILLHRAGEEHAATLLRHPVMKLRNARFSPDQRWIVFSAQRNEEPHQTFIVPFQPDHEIPFAVWQPGATVTAVNAEWSIDGQRLYFLSEQDGFLCLWEQRLDGGKRPLGEARAIRHFHHAALDLWQISHNRRALAVARDKVVLNLLSRTGGIWLLR